MKMDLQKANWLHNPRERWTSRKTACWVKELTRVGFANLKEQITVDTTRCPAILRKWMDTTGHTKPKLISEPHGFAIWITSEWILSRRSPGISCQHFRSGNGCADKRNEKSSSLGDWSSYIPLSMARERDRPPRMAAENKDKIIRNGSSSHLRCHAIPRQRGKPCKAWQSPISYYLTCN
jgi:hypothetical protein